MTVREYIGARYVPLFIGEWSDQNAYEPLSIVTYQGNSYTSRQAVPIGIQITDSQYWVCTANYNAQVEQYRREVLELSGTVSNQAVEITNNTENITTNTADITSNAANIAKVLAYSDLIVPLVDFDNFNAELAAANADGKYLFIPSIDSEIGLTVPNSARLIIGNWSYKGNDYALTITDGIRGNIYIDTLYTLTGGGIKIDPQIIDTTANVPIQSSVYVRIMDCAGGSCFYCHNNNHVLYNKYGGVNWNCRNDNCIDIKPATGKYVGELHFDVMHMQSTTQTCIKLDFSNGYCTGLDFGVTSLEGSRNGIHIISYNNSTGSNHGLERIFGNFRIVEVVNGEFQLKLEGYARWFSGHILFDFDFVNPDKIDLSGLTDTAYTLVRHLCAVIRGTIAGNWNAVNEMFVIGGHLCFKNNIGYFAGSVATDQPLPTVIEARGDMTLTANMLYCTFIIKNSSTAAITISLEDSQNTITLQPDEIRVVVPMLSSSGQSSFNSLILQ